MLNSDSELLKTLEENGMVNSTKNYLKNQLIETLKKQKIKNENLNSKLSQYKNSPISSLIRLSYSLIMDFFSKMNLPYSQSTFNYEAKSIFFNTCVPYTESEIINLLNINMYEFEKSKNNILLGINEPNILNTLDSIDSKYIDRVKQGFNVLGRIPKNLAIEYIEDGESVGKERLIISNS